jgi:hypothetical protein
MRPLPEKFSYGKKNVTALDCWYEVRYPKDSFNPQGSIVGGFGAYDPLPKPLTYMNYKVYFPKGFDWNKGGKLHGLYFGDGASGGEHPLEGGSVRLMWRRGGQVDVYLYYPSMKEVYGESNLIPSCFFKTECWNDINIHFNDGKLVVVINNTFKFSKLVDFGKPCTGIFYSTFFGGSDKTWATKKDQIVRFSNCSLFEF